MDRLAPTRRPDNQRVVMRQAWQELLFLHWEVEADTVAALLPPGLSVDTFDGKTYLGLVPFTMRDVRPVWSPVVPWLSHFHETNVRVYVHHEGRDPGVWFCSLDAANPIAVELARFLWKLPYHTARMHLLRGTESVAYATERRTHPPLPAHCRVTYAPHPATTLRIATPGTREHFLIERYILYAYAHKRLYSGRVWHEPYRYQPARYTGLDQNLTDVAGFPGLDRPLLAHYAPGVAVDVYPLRPVE